MFDLFSWSHILILLTVALVVVGPKDLPRLMHMAANGWARPATWPTNSRKASTTWRARASWTSCARRSRSCKATIRSPTQRMHRPRDRAHPQSGGYADIGPEPRAEPNIQSHRAAAPRGIRDRRNRAGHRDRDRRAVNAPTPGRRSGARRHARAADGASDRAAQAADLGDALVRRLLCRSASPFRRRSSIS